MAQIFPDSLLNDIHNKVKLSDFISQYTQLKKRGDEFVGLCPFHKESGPSFTVNDIKGVYYCFGCGAKGDVIDFVINKKNVKFYDAVSEIANLYNIYIPPQNAETANVIRQKKEILLFLNDIADFFRKELFTPLGTKALKYIKKRNISQELVDKYKLGYAPSNNKLIYYVKSKNYDTKLLEKAGLIFANRKEVFRDRLIFPIIDSSGNVIAFGGRALGDSSIKYINSPNTIVFEKGLTLYGYYDNQEIDKDIGVILVEGYMDVIAMSKIGVGNAFAPLGTATNKDHILSLWKKSDNITVCFDGDEAGIKAMLRLADIALTVIVPGKAIKFCILPSKMDPDEYVNVYGKDFVEKILKKSIYLSDLLWNEQYGKINPNNAETWAQLENKLMGKVNLVTDKSIKNHMRSQYWNKINDAKRNKLSSKKINNDMYTRTKETNNINKISLIENMIIFIVIHYPQILKDNDVMNDFFHLKFHEDQTNELRKLIIDFAETNEQLSRQNILSYLNDNDVNIDNICRSIHVKPLTHIKEDKAVLGYQYTTTMLYNAHIEGEYEYLAKEDGDFDKLKILLEIMRDNEVKINNLRSDLWELV